jgi:hypothetical protein
MPLSINNMTASSGIMFVYSWNQFLWPLLVMTGHVNFATPTTQLQKFTPYPLFGVNLAHLARRIHRHFLPFRLLQIYLTAHVGAAGECNLRYNQDWPQSRQQNGSEQARLYDVISRTVR